MKKPPKLSKKQVRELRDWYKRSRELEERGNMATKTIVRYRSRPKLRHRSRAKPTIPTAIVMGMIPTVLDMYGAWKYTGDIRTPFEHLCMAISGYNPADHSWAPRWALQTFWLPMGAGIAAHKLANMFGINRALGRAGVPFIRI